MSDGSNKKPKSRATVEERSESKSSGLVNRLLQQYPDLAIPENFLSFVAKQEALRHPIRRADTGRALDRFLFDIGVDGNTVCRFLDSDSRLVSKLSYPSLLQRPVDEVRSQLEERLSAVFPLQQAVLDSEVLTGFNRHDRAHLRSVTRRMLALLRARERKSPTDAQTEKEATIAGYLHDSGNL
ncbi:MAG: hypothetical protein GTO63_06740, partial [Anaerolineae bacterium]|nr:hypothetical protein [Anaerolineae bacterium]NIN93564.1 hypothetical protein [Anaerolineae bacterium]NIQ76647.1 hypothetical protein [Anaerolineae bacterium]